MSVNFKKNHVHFFSLIYAQSQPISAKYDGCLFLNDCLLMLSQLVGIIFLIVYRYRPSVIFKTDIKSSYFLYNFFSYNDINQLFNVYYMIKPLTRKRLAESNCAQIENDASDSLRVAMEKLDDVYEEMEKVKKALTSLKRTSGAM